MLVLLLGSTFCSTAQTLVSQMGPVRFFNSLDSAKSAQLTGIAGRCYCLLQILDSTHSKRLKLDLGETAVNDSVFYLLDFNNLSGDYAVPDSVVGFMDTLSETPGIHIKALDTVLRPEIIFWLLDYGVRNYAELQRQKNSGKTYDKEFTEAILKQKPSLSFRKAMARCK
jgi:hypothetical protein